MSEEVIKMPNSIGQMDSFTEAAKAGDLELALSILDTEIERRLSKFGTADLERKKADEGYYEAKTFRFNIAKGVDTWNQCRRACGWNPDELAEVKAAGPVVMRVEDLQEGDEVVEGGRGFAFAGFDSEGDLRFSESIRFYRTNFDERLKRGALVYRTTDGVRTRISGWPVGEHPAEAENKRLREENEALRFERDKGFDRKFQNTLAGVEARQAENERLKNELDAARSEIERLRKEDKRKGREIDEWMAVAVEGLEDDDVPLWVYQLRNTRPGLRGRIEWLRNELGNEEIRNAAWQAAANYTPSGTPLAKPVTDPDGLIARLKGMIEASEGLQRQLDDPELDIDRVLATAYEYASEPIHPASNHDWPYTLIATSIKILYGGPPAFNPYRLKQ